jgi:hypothetical protein
MEGSPAVSFEKKENKDDRFRMGLDSFLQAFVIAQD